MGSWGVGGGVPYQGGLLQKGAQLGTPGKRMAIVPWTDGLLPPAGRRAHAPASGPPGRGRTRMNDQQAVQSGCPGAAIQTLCLCAADPGGFRMRKSTDPCAPDGNGLAQRQDCNKEDTNTRPPPSPPFPRALHEFCLRQSPPAAFIEAAESRDDQPDATPAAPYPCHRKAPNKETKLHQHDFTPGKATSTPRRAGLHSKVR